MPKFKVEYEIELNEVLKQLHMGTMFSSRADLTGLLADDDDKALYVSKVIHKAFIEVDEEGSTAGGSTGKIQSPLPNPVKFMDILWNIHWNHFAF